MKSKTKSAKTNHPAKATFKLRRAATPAVALRQGTTGRHAPAAEPAGGDTSLLRALALTTETGKIKLETSSMTPSQLHAQLVSSGTGMSTTPVYSGLPVTPDVNAAATALGQQLTQLGNLERDLREFRLTLSQWTVTYASVLNRAATACEAADSTPATLISGGWQLRRTPGPAQPVPAPKDLGILQTAFAGQGTGRWSRVPNARYYELMAAPVPGAALTIDAPVIIKSTRTRCPLPLVPPGTQLTICVRAIGSKGDGPFCDPLTVRVN